MLPPIWLALKSLIMTKSLGLYCCMYGHIETLARAIAEGAQEATDTRTAVKQVPESVLKDVAKQAGVKLDLERRLLNRVNRPITTASSSAHRLAQVICPHRCAAFRIRPAAYGRRTRWSVKLEKCSPIRPVKMGSRDDFNFSPGSRYCAWA